MRVMLMRHGIAVDRDDPACPPDPERPLTPKGRLRVEESARGLLALDEAPARVVASPLLRARQTVEIVGRVLDSRLLVPEPSLAPDVSGEDLAARVVALAGEGDGALLLVGHSPSLEAGLACLLGLDHAPWHFKKAGVAAVDLHAGDAALAWLASPRMLRFSGRGGAQPR